MKNKSIVRILNRLEVSAELKPSDFVNGKQKDWIIYDYEKRNLFCLAIVDHGKGWVLEEWVNFFDLKPKELCMKVSMGIHTMLMAAQNRDNYEYVIGKHNFNKEQINNDYWNALISKENFFGMETLKKKINYKEFHDQVSILVGEKDILFP